MMEDLRKRLAAGIVDHRAIDEHVGEMTHLSATRINTWSNCSMLYYLSYVLGLKRRPSVAMLRGSAVHESVELNANSRIQTGEPAPRDAVQDAAAEGFTRRAEEEDPELRDGETVGGAKDSVVALASLHYDDVAPNSIPLHSEEQFLMEWDDDDIDPPIKGFVDLVTRQGKDVVVEEVKTAVGSRTDRGKYMNPLQVSIYLMAFRELMGATRAQVNVLAEKHLKSGVRHEVVVHELDASNLNVALVTGTARQMMNSLRLHVVGPANPNYYLCHKKWCGYHQSNGGPCPYGRTAQ